MSFHRASIDKGGRISEPSRAGAGFTANVIALLLVAETDETITMAELSGGMIVQGTTLTSDVTYTLPTSVLVEAQWSEMDVGDTYVFCVTNAQAAAFDVVIAVGAGMTKQGANNTLSVPPQCSRMFVIEKTSNTAHKLY